MGDMTKHGQRLMVAKGSWHGLGNSRFQIFRQPYAAAENQRHARAISATCCWS
ncbi:hypothetical protein KIF59_17270 [Enterobacter cloacae subsp. cloacae]|nr:hypothetical protein [Enterobacter cloacae subsp. cloacae]